MFCRIFDCRCIYELLLFLRINYCGNNVFLNKYCNLLGNWIVSLCFILVAFLPVANIFNKHVIFGYRDLI